MNNYKKHMEHKKFQGEYCIATLRKGDKVVKVLKMLTYLFLFL